MAKPHIYTVGYQGWSLEDLEEMIVQMSAKLIDVRFHPGSRNPDYSRKRLSERFGDLYHWEKSFGNPNYKNDGPLALVDYAAGRAFLETLEQPAVLMCACARLVVCHRKLIAARLEKDGFTITHIQ
jgi:uncharacterized protein (DUF488 family)